MSAGIKIVGALASCGDAKIVCHMVYYPSDRGAHWPLVSRYRLLLGVTNHQYSICLSLSQAG